MIKMLGNYVDAFVAVLYLEMPCHIFIILFIIINVFIESGLALAVFTVNPNQKCHGRS